MSRCYTEFPIGGLGEPEIYHQSVDFTRKRGRLWKESAPKLMGVKSFLELVRLVQLKKCGNDCIMITKPKLDLGIHLVK